MRLPLPKIDRRTLLIGGGVGVGLVVAYALWPRRSVTALRAGDGEAVYGHFLKIGGDGTVTVAVPAVETGQGAWTGLAQIAADELGADWQTVAVEPAPLAAVYSNPLASGAGWLDGVGPLRRHRIAGEGLMRVTAGSASVRGYEPALRLAGAAARAMLIQAAARRWGVRAEECDTDGGRVVHEGKGLGFGELAVAAAGETPPDDPPLRNGGGKLVGQPLPRLDLPGKTDGSARFAGDVRLPGMLFASARIAPPGGRLNGYSRSARLGVQLITGPGWLAAVAPTWWAAEQAIKAAGARFTGPADADLAAVEARLDAALDGEAVTLLDRGGAGVLVTDAAPMKAAYRVAPACHLGLEPLTATASFTHGRLEVWAPSQAPGFAREAAARAAGLTAADVIFYPMPVGAACGRALEADAVPIAVELAKRLRRPVQLTIPASHSRNHDVLRPPAVARMAAMPSAEGGVAAWTARIASAPGESAAFARLDGREPSTGFTSGDLAGAVPPYSGPAMLVEGGAAALPIRTGYMRGGSHLASAFFSESFIDEMARTLGAEPLAFRVGMLAGNPRLANVLLSAARIGGWDGGGAGSTMGLACHAAFGSHIGLLAQAAIGSDQRIAVSRLVAVVDCGRVINPDLVRQQVEGGLIAALALAIEPAPELAAGMPVARRAEALPRLSGTPAISVELVDSRQSPGGVSGLAHSVLAPAVANAIHAGTGKRLRSLPFDAMSAA